MRGPGVGIFWGVPDGAGVAVVTDRTSLGEAEVYGAFLTHPRGHFEVWEGWRRLGAAGLVRAGLPGAIAWHEYEQFPRGRVVFDTRSWRFRLYADERLLGRAMVGGILRVFGIEEGRCDVWSDGHYRAVADV